MLFRPAVLKVTASVAWGATVIGMFTGFDGHRAFTALDRRIWTCVLSVAILTSLPLLLGAEVSGRIDRAYTSMARAFAFIQRETPAPQPHGRHAALTVVRGQDKARP